MIIEFKAIRGEGILTENVSYNDNLIDDTVSHSLESSVILKVQSDFNKIWRNINFVIWTNFRLNILSPLIDQILERLNDDN